MAHNKNLPDLEIRLFGPMEVRVCGQPLPRLRSRKGLWLLALLALRDSRAVERDWLCGALWPEDSSPDARTSLRQSLHDLRRAMGPAGARLRASTGHSVSLDLEGAFVDALAFDQAVSRAEEASSAQAVGLRRGPLLEGCGEEWVLPERQARDRAYVSSLETLAKAAGERGDRAAETNWLRRATSEEPYREDLWRGLMQALAAAGDPIAALSAYREFRDILWRETSTEPESETTGLFRSIRDGLRTRALLSAHPPPRPLAVPPVPAAARTIPEPLTPLIGRDEDVCDVSALLSTARLVTLLGAGGVGKTRLAVEVARGLAAELDERAWFADLAALSDPVLVADAVRMAVGMETVQTVAGPMASLARWIGVTPSLLVMDNCEHLLAACRSVVEQLLRQCPQLRVLATSRTPLGTPGEAVWRVPSLAFPAPARQGGLERHSMCPEELAASFPAVRLFAERAAASDRQFRLTAENLGAVVGICRRLDGMPLAIELAAARVRSLPVMQICSRIQAGFDLLNSSETERVTRRQTLDAAFDWSWRLLSEPERCALMRLSVFAGGWTLEAAESVCAGGELRAHAVANLLSALVDSSLVIYSPADEMAGGPESHRPEYRYRLLETVREYAAGRLAAAGDEAATRARHRDYYLDWSEALRDGFTEANRQAAFDSLEREHDNLRKALDWSTSRQDRIELLRLCIALAPFWDTRGYLREGRAMLEEAIALARDDTPAMLRARALGQIGWIAYLQGDPAAADYFGQAHELCSRDAPALELARLLNMWALAVANTGDLSRARELFEQALALFRSIQPPVRLAGVLDNIGCLEIRAGNLDAARSHVEEAVAQCVGPAAGSQTNGIVLQDLAIIDFRQGRYQEAERHAQEALSILHSCAASITIPDTLSVLGIIVERKSGWERTAKLLALAAELRARTGASVLPLIAEEVAESAAAAERALGADCYQKTLAAGREMRVEDVLRGWE